MTLSGVEVSAFERRRSRLDGRPDVRRGGYDVVVPLAGFSPRVAVAVQCQVEAIDGQRRDVAQAQVLVVGDELAVEPQCDTAVACPGVLARTMTS
jgi:hypothetical protein